MAMRSFTPILLALLPLAACSEEAPRVSESADATEQQWPAPTDPRRLALGEGEGEDDDADREARAEWFERMHRAAPGVDWRAIEEQNRRAKRLSRNALAQDPGGAFQGREAAGGSAPWFWEEVGSRNQAGHTRCAAVGAARGGERSLYVGSALGGLWRGTTDGEDWTPLSDGAFGGFDDVVALEPADLADPDLLVVRRGATVLRSEDGGATWVDPIFIGGTLVSGRRMVRAGGPRGSILLFGAADVPGVGRRSALFGSDDEGRSFWLRHWFGARWDGDVWTPRTANATGDDVWVLQAGRLHRSFDGGWSFGTPLVVDTGATAGDLAGSEAGGPILYMALRQSSGDWNLHRSDDAGATSGFVRTLDAFWGATTSMVAFAYDANRLIYGGVEAYVSTDRGATATRINTWGSYYGDPANRLHADIRGISGLVVDLGGFETDTVYFNTDGGTYVSYNGGTTVQNLSLEGLGVGQFYSTHTSSLDPRRISGGTQDQGYQVGTRAISLGEGPSTAFDQIISGDYGHLTSGDGTHEYVYSTYPGFILVQRGETSPTLRFVDFPAGSTQLWLPPVVADPTDRRRFFFLGRRLHRYEPVGGGNWAPTQWSNVDFAAGGGLYLTAMGFAPSDPNRAYALTTQGVLHVSNDGGVTWSSSANGGPRSHYFYGSAVLVDPQDPDHAYFAGAGYSTAAVRETTDGGATWQARSSGLPSTLIHDIAFSPDGSGDLFAAGESGAYHYDAQTRTWSDALGADAPVTTYWSVETVEGSSRVRFGTYGRGIWDLALVGDGGEVGDRYCGPAVVNASIQAAEIRGTGSPFLADDDLTLTASKMPPNTFGFFIVSPNPGEFPTPGSSVGTLCLDAPFGRYFTHILNSGTTGSFSMAVDTSAIPQPSQVVAAEVGQTWYFQAWFRDVYSNLSSSNFTDGLAVRFR